MLSLRVTVQAVSWYLRSPSIVVEALLLFLSRDTTCPIAQKRLSEASAS